MGLGRDRLDFKLMHYHLILQADFSQHFRKAMAKISPNLEAGGFPGLNDDADQELLLAVRTVINYYEFVAVGIRHGDIDERLFQDTRQSTILRLFDACHDHIYDLRSDRVRQSTYEHFEWLKGRWTNKKPGPLKKMIEWLRGRPNFGKRTDNS